MSESIPYLNETIFEKFIIKKKIGKGSFGTVYEGEMISTKQRVAMKFEERTKSEEGILKAETYRLLYLKGDGIPKVYCYGVYKQHNILIQELLDKSLDELFNKCHKKFTLKTVCILGIEMLKRIKFIHSKNHIHRDIKPDNFMTGVGENKNKIYLIDFGLSKKYYSETKKKHIKFITGKSLIGTARYCGRNAHKGYEQGRRDDLESIGYVLMYFLLGKLPWQGLKLKHGEDLFQKIAKKKISTSFEDLTKNQPEQFLNYFKYCDRLEFEEEPDYDYLMSLFHEILEKNKINRSLFFDWDADHENRINIEEQDSKSKDISLLVRRNTDNKSEDVSEDNVDIEKNNKSSEDNNIKIKFTESKEHKNILYESCPYINKTLFSNLNDNEDNNNNNIRDYSTLKNKSSNFNEINNYNYINKNERVHKTHKIKKIKIEEENISKKDLQNKSEEDNENTKKNDRISNNSGECDINKSKKDLNKKNRVVNRKNSNNVTNNKTYCCCLIF